MPQSPKHVTQGAGAICTLPLSREKEGFKQGKGARHFFVRLLWTISGSPYLYLEAKLGVGLLPHFATFAREMSGEGIAKENQLGPTMGCSFRRFRCTTP